MTNRAKLISPREREGGTEKVTRENSRKFSTQDESEKEKHRGCSITKSSPKESSKTRQTADEQIDFMLLEI